MKWAVLTSCFFPNEKPIRMLAESMKIQGDYPDLRHYGLGQLYANWTRMKVDMMIPVLEQFQREGITHYLYTDGRDAFFLRPWSAIMQAWKDIGSPDILLSGQPTSFPLESLAGNYTSGERYRFHCCGGYLGSVDAWLETHRRFVRDNYEARETGGDEAGVWQWAWADGWFRPQVDSGCRIFQNMGDVGEDVKLWGHMEKTGWIKRGDEFKFDHMEVVNMHTKSAPSLIHFTGYCKSAEFGVYDDMLPWWNAVYPNHPIAKEEVRAC